MTEPVPIETIRGLCAALERLCESTDADSVAAESVRYALARFSMWQPSQPPSGADRIRAAAGGQAVVIGQYADRSGLSDFCYGPYDPDRATAVANILQTGIWHGMYWQVMPIDVLPGESA